MNPQPAPHNQDPVGTGSGQVPIEQVDEQYAAASAWLTDNCPPKGDLLTKKAAQVVLKSFNLFHQKPEYPHGFSMLDVAKAIGRTDKPMTNLMHDVADRDKGTRGQWINKYPYPVYARQKVEIEEKKWKNMWTFTERGVQLAEFMRARHDTPAL
jgi:hypothetical protein